ncbi:MAG: mannose-1-phosphate guanylyltransferase [Deltaproteobacteria bacterium]|nr:mannose-1-phosphate guanylyltransferase [Deltaproteobacteria bacterium]
MKQSIFPIILAGGKGTRFWPLSRSLRPKQLLKIVSPKTLVRETAERVFPLSGPERTLVVTVTNQLKDLARELRVLPRGNFIAEPQGKNTAPCIGLAALEVAERDPDGVMVVVPSDHWVADSSAFRRTLKKAVELAARKDYLVTIGIRPDYPETGYGYILKDAGLRTRTIAGASLVKSFQEKPNASTARRLIRQGALWNSGIFVWRAKVLLDALRRHQPAIADLLTKIRGAAGGKTLAGSSSRLSRLIAREYNRMPNISVDYAVLEKAAAEKQVATLEGSFGWSDIGSWSAVHRMMHQDDRGNAATGKWLGLGAKNCLIYSPDRLVVLLGIEGAVVVDTPDALLVGDLKRAQEVRELVELLKKRGFGSYTIK